MRILHTSDWHLGKRLFKLDRLEEQSLFLDWLITTLKEQKIDFLLIAGDIFDTPTPPHQALQLFYDFLGRVSAETQTETLVIAGNHDSGLLLEAPAKLLSPHRVKVWGKLSENPADHWMTIKKGAEELEVCALPFFRSYEILRDGNTDAIASLKNYLLKKKTIPQLLMLHHLAGMSEAGGSEQVVTLSGVDSIPTDILATFDYVALGHIHKPQRIGEKIYYSGSPIPMRFSESYAKSVMLLDLKEGKLGFEKFPIPVFRPIITVKADETNYKEKILAIPEWKGLTTQVEIQLSLTAPRVGLIDEIKDLLTKRGAELLSYQPLYIQNEKVERKNEKLFELSPLELFEEFYATKYPESPEIPLELKSDFAELLDKVKHASS